MHVHDAIDAVVVFLHGDEALDGPEIIPEMEIAGGLNAREHQLLELRHRLELPRDVHASRRILALPQTTFQCIV